MYINPVYQHICNIYSMSSCVPSYDCKMIVGTSREKKYNKNFFNG